MSVMPFVAMLGAERIVSLDLDEIRWAALRGKELTMPGCGVRAIAKSSSLGTRFFAHHSTSGCTTIHKPESRQHRALKAAVYFLVGETPGWRAVLEHPGPDRRWVADVLAIGPAGQRIAFEIQLSTQSTQAWEERTQAYFDDGILPVWVTPHTDRYERIRLPMVHTGITKESALPADPTDLLRERVWHPFERRERSLGYRLQDLLLARQVWTDGSPAEQRARHAAEDRARAQQEEAVRREHERQRAALEAQKVAARAAHEARFRRFVDTVVSIEAPPVPAAGNIWGASVACPRCNERSVVWTCGKDGAFHVSEELTMYRAERTPWAKDAIGRWLTGTAHTEARLVHSARHRQLRFLCPECHHRIPQDLIASIPEPRWSRASVLGVVPPRQGTPADLPDRPRAPRTAVQPAAAKRPAPPRPPATPATSVLPL
ncbi:hypothetical protein GCM10009715_42100 [Paeniglutamicibacter psychrophenolicus]|uniref:Competence protein CoiA nuclease-like domain-containing protein n=1 Tax=Paeniglutamicibacter psychrophenolicus TaxID=257454 RepID=A0ABS4WK84_9MICC|nr:competence protein CoiA family protein [Paeniglutamicibacter psychrophenolicus]MBP2376451.1 hypothetical protein [Paeniglutamicibacter psychrophenolicus]